MFHWVLNTPLWKQLFKKSLNEDEENKKIKSHIKKIYALNFKICLEFFNITPERVNSSVEKIENVHV